MKTAFIVLGGALLIVGYFIFMPMVFVYANTQVRWFFTIGVAMAGIGNVLLIIGLNKSSMSQYMLSG